MNFIEAVNHVKREEDIAVDEAREMLNKLIDTGVVEMSDGEVDEEDLEKANFHSELWS